MITVRHNKVYDNNDVLMNYVCRTRLGENIINQADVNNWLHKNH